MKAEVEAFFAEDVAVFTREIAELDARLGPDAEPREDERYGELCAMISRSVEACRRLESSIRADRRLLADVQERFRREISPWMDRSWVGHRCKVKPRGYPGDHEMLTALYRRVPKSKGLGGYVDIYWFNALLTRAIWARWHAAKAFLLEEVGHRRGDVHVLNVACGPCREYVDGFPHPNDCHLRITCIDNDPEALAYVESNVATGNGAPDIRCVRYNALRMTSAKANVKQFGRADVIYSIGLCDYLPDKQLVRLIQGLSESLTDDGVLFVALKDCRRYDKTECQWLLDWYFFQRTEEDCRELYRQAGLDPDHLEMTRDATGVIMNFVSRAKGEAPLRADLPHERRERPAKRAVEPALTAPAVYRKSSAGKQGKE